MAARFVIKSHQLRHRMRSKNCHICLGVIKLRSIRTNKYFSRLQSYVPPGTSELNVVVVSCSTNKPASVAGFLITIERLKIKMATNQNSTRSHRIAVYYFIFNGVPPRSLFQDVNKFIMKAYTRLTTRHESVTCQSL